MGFLRVREAVNILGIGIGSSFLVFLIIQVGFAQVLTDYVLKNINKEFTLFLIIFGLLLISLISSITTSFLVTEFVHEISILYASVMAFYCSFCFLIAISYFYLFMYYPSIFRNIHGFAMFLIFPQVIITFSIYILGNIGFLVIINIFSYYFFYLIFLNQFYIVKIKSRV